MFLSKIRSKHHVLLIEKQITFSNINKIFCFTSELFFIHNDLSNSILTQYQSIIVIYVQ